MDKWRFLFGEFQTYRVMTLVTDSPSIPPDNVTGLNSLLSGGFSFIPLPPISETDGDEYLTVETIIPTIPSLLNLKDTVTKLT